jgi:DNA polymerase
VLRERGQWQVDPAGRRVLVTLHPSELLRGDPQQREDASVAWLKDLSLASGILASKVTTEPGRQPRAPSTHSV